MGLKLASLNMSLKTVYIVKMVLVIFTGIATRQTFIYKYTYGIVFAVKYVFIESNIFILFKNTSKTYLYLVKGLIVELLL